MLRLAIRSLWLSRLTLFHCPPSQVDHVSPEVPDTSWALSLCLVHAIWTRCAAERCQAMLMQDFVDCTSLQQAET